MSEHEFWIAFRRALLLIVDAIERREGLGKYAKPAEVPISKSDSIS